MQVFGGGDVTAIQDDPGVAGVNRQVALGQFRQGTGEDNRRWSIGRKDGRVERDGIVRLRVQQGLTQGAGTTIGRTGDCDRFPF